MTHLEHFAAEHRKAVTRRWFFSQCGVGLGAIALGKLLGENSASAAMAALTNPLAPKAPHFKPRAKNIIYLFMAGAPGPPPPFEYKQPAPGIMGGGCAP